MNQKIEEISKRASEYACNTYPDQDSYGRSPDQRKWMSIYSTKFAELIVRQCLDHIGDRHICDEIRDEFGIVDKGEW